MNPSNPNPDSTHSSDLPDSPDMQVDLPTHTPQKSSFLQTLLTNSPHDLLPPHIQPTPLDLDLIDESDNPDESADFIPLSADDKARLYSSWKFSIIIKLFGKSIGHQLLKAKLQSLWKPTELLHLIDLGSAFFLIKFTQKNNMLHALHDGPWFILGHFLSVRRWEPKFVASTAQLTNF